MNNGRKVLVGPVSWLCVPCSEIPYIHRSKHTPSSSPTLQALVSFLLFILKGFCYCSPMKDAFNLLHPVWCLLLFAGFFINIKNSQSLLLCPWFPMLPMLQFTLKNQDKILLLLLISTKQKTVKKAANIKILFFFFCLDSLQP